MKSVAISVGIGGGGTGRNRWRFPPKSVAVSLGAHQLLLCGKARPLLSRPGFGDPELTGGVSLAFPLLVVLELAGGLDQHVGRDAQSTPSNSGLWNVPRADRVLVAAAAELDER